MSERQKINRRQFIGMAGTLATTAVLPSYLFATTNTISKPIPSSGERLPVIGMGTSRTFDASHDTPLLERLQRVTQTFFDMGGGMIDSSPMYGSSQQVIGQLLPKVTGERNLFSATKVWIDGKTNGIEQMEQSRQLWGIEHFDLMQIHNLVDWRIHLETLQKMKANGLIRYIGITTSHGRYHRQLAQILKEHRFDFVQLTYNIGNRDVESELLPIAQDRGIAVIANRPFQRGSLFRKIRGKALPSWAKEFQCDSWAQFFLKFIVSHPSVTCAIPATSKEKHMADNMRASQGRLPTLTERTEMIRYFQSL